MQSFPKPLTSKEESSALLALSSSSPTLRENAREQLIVHNLRLVAHIARKYTTLIQEKEDYISIGIIGLIKAIDSFNPSRGIHLATYASRCIENELLMMLRASKKQAKDISLYESIGSDKEGNEIQLLDILESEVQDLAEKMDLSHEIKRLRVKLSRELDSREFMVLALRYGLLGKNPITQREIASQFHISRSYISRIEKKALEKLRRSFSQDEQI